MTAIVNENGNLEHGICWPETHRVFGSLSGKYLECKMRLINQMWRMEVMCSICDAAADVVRRLKRKTIY